MTTVGRPAWRTSTRTENGANCVEVAFTGDGVFLRDTKDRGTGPVIEFTGEQWPAFVRETLLGLPSANGVVMVHRREDGGAEVRAVATGVRLRFTRGEWAAFVEGARDGEFDRPQAPALSG